MTNPKDAGKQPPGRAPGSRKVPNPGDVLAAAQSAVEAAQTAAGQALDAARLTAGYSFDAAVRLPPASAQLASQLPDLLDNLSTAIDRLNSTIDRLDRTLALADPAFAAYDRLLPRLEAMISLGEDLFGALSKLPGVSMLGRLAGRGEESAEPDQPDRGSRSRDSKRR
ncbi:hypothetical protein GV794_19065 [Nocardia cyriacigeorgica]|uniref:Uncharacterized protein n=1 Tax=Nocardia cyriacigeorgica TaxID=135487 RepID=A0A6P1DDL5_9NOCA|nr:hypothetical protein [Nocardia cyriacigeorgica]NEW40069.1 hypothetical protein [Nocardia cyriacigeorgica]NEW47639.1 hypothetical protein [Nocardia cyriacigeorgica]NEW51605.1 hypothetical protein [Nocardia cyriacigeorgica]NEW57742.1 hypothetical protein [Nocardia cyriacigeorgica]